MLGTLYGILVFWGCSRNKHKPGSLQFWKPEVGNQDVGLTVLSLTAPGENPSLPLPGLMDPDIPWFLITSYLSPSSHGLLSCVSLSFAVSYKDALIGFRAHPNPV